MMKSKVPTVDSESSDGSSGTPSSINPKFVFWIHSIPFKWADKLQILLKLSTNFSKGKDREIWESSKLGGRKLCVDEKTFDFTQKLKRLSELIHLIEQVVDCKFIMELFS